MNIFSWIHVTFILNECLTHLFLAYLTLYVIIYYTVLRCFYHFGNETFKLWKCCYWVNCLCVIAGLLMQAT